MFGKVEENARVYTKDVNITVRRTLDIQWIR